MVLGKFLLQVGTGAAGIGGGSEAQYASCSNITIAGGVISVSSGNLGSGIGAGYSSGAFVNNINISGGDITTVAVGSGIGIGRNGGKCSNITISGGKVKCYSWYEGCGIKGNPTENIKILGGTINIYTSNGASRNPAIGGSTVSNVVITGGNTQLNSDDINKKACTIPLTDEAGNEVYCTTLIINGVNQEMKIDNVEYQNFDGKYNLKDAYTTSNGKVYLWLPQGAKVKSITVSGNKYVIDTPIEAGNSGTFYNN